MKKLLLSVITILLIVLVVITAVKGFKIGSIDLMGIAQLKDENEKLDSKVQQATKLASTDYESKLDNLNTSIKKLETEKSQYQDIVSVSTDSEVEAANQLYFYELDFLWVRIGNHAKSEGIKMDVSAKDLTEIEGATTSIQADKKYRCTLNFTATGSYIGIASFIEDIEDDSKLGFKIEDFKITPSSNSSNTLTATFTCKDIVIKGISTTSSNNNAESEENAEKSNQKQQNNQTVTDSTDNTIENNTEK